MLNFSTLFDFLRAQCLPSKNFTIPTQLHLDTAGLFIALAVTLWTTVLIAYRIYSASKGILKGRKYRFYRILEIIIQSSFIYSIALLADALLGTIPPRQSNFCVLAAISAYAGTILTTMTVC